MRRSSPATIWRGICPFLKPGAREAQRRVIISLPGALNTILVSVQVRKRARTGDRLFIVQHWWFARVSHLSFTRVDRPRRQLVMRSMVHRSGSTKRMRSYPKTTPALLRIGALPFVSEQSFKFWCSNAVRAGAKFKFKFRAKATRTKLAAPSQHIHCGPTEQPVLLKNDDNARSDPWKQDDADDDC